MASANVANTARNRDDLAIMFCLPDSHHVVFTRTADTGGDGSARTRLQRGEDQIRSEA
jgi:hypothetical protein